MALMIAPVSPDHDECFEEDTEPASEMLHGRVLRMLRSFLSEPGYCPSSVEGTASCSQDDRGSTIFLAPCLSLVHNNHASEQHEGIADFATHLLERPLEPEEGNTIHGNIGASLKLLVESRLRAFVMHEIKRQRKHKVDSFSYVPLLDKLLQQECVVQDVRLECKPAASSTSKDHLEVLFQVQASIALGTVEQQISIQTIGKAQLHENILTFQVPAMHHFLHRMMKAAFRLVAQVVEESLRDLVSWNEEASNTKSLDMLSSVALESANAVVSPALRSMPPPPSRKRKQLDDIQLLSAEECEHIVDDIFDDFNFITKKHKASI